MMLGVLVAVMVALFAAPAFAAYRTDSGGPNGPCRPGDSVHLALRYKGDANVSFVNRDGTYRLWPLPYHREARTEWIDTNQNGLKWWKLAIVSDQGYVSRDGSYGLCGW